MTSERHFDVFIVNFAEISHYSGVSIVDFADWVKSDVSAW